MNQYCYILGIAACWMTVSPVAAQSSNQPPSPPAVVTVAGENNRIGTFKEVKPNAWVTAADKRKAARPGGPVVVGERISTDSKGSASLTLKDGTVLTLGPNTTVDLSQFQFDTTTQEGSLALDVLQGTLRVITGLLAKVNPERFRIKTPTAVVGVRGTDFIVEATPPRKRAKHRPHPTR